MPTRPRYAPDTPFKQFLLACLDAPQSSYYPTNKQAHQARFAFYNGMRQLRRGDDPWGDTRELLEAVVIFVKDDCWELRIQRKTTHLMNLIGQAGFVAQTATTTSPHYAADSPQYTADSHTPTTLSPEDQALLDAADAFNAKLDEAEREAPEDQ